MTFTAKALSIKGSNAAFSLAHVRVVNVHDVAAITTGPAIPSQTARTTPSPDPNTDAPTPAEHARAMTHQSAFIALLRLATPRGHDQRVKPDHYPED